MARLLVIDDEASIRKLLQEALSRVGHEVLDAPEGRSGMALLQEQTVDVVITDLLMPEQEGIETILALRKTFPQIKVIAISGGGKRGFDFLSAAAHFGAHRTIEKPFEIQEIVEAIQSVLENG
jgi:DNA-binding NtrC family response regulator